MNIPNEESILKLIKNLEQSLSIPLSDNKYFHQIVLLTGDPKYSVSLINSSLPIILKTFYKKSPQNEEPIISIISLLIQSNPLNIDYIAINANFLEIAFNFINNNVQQRKNEKYEKRLEKINNIIANKLQIWFNILAKFSLNQKIVDFIVNNMFELIRISITFLEKSNESYSDFRTIIQKCKINIYKFLENLLKSRKDLASILLQNNELILKLFINIHENLDDFREFVCFSALTVFLTKDPKFPIFLKDKNLIDSLFYQKITYLLFETFRPKSWQTFLNIKQENSILIEEFCEKLSENFYNFTRTKEMRTNIKNLFAVKDSDFTFRYLLYCVRRKAIKAVFFTIVAILNLIKQKNYKFPFYATKIFLVLFKEINDSQNNLILVCILRIAKYLKFLKNDKIIIFNCIYAILNNKIEIINNIIQIDLAILDNLICFPQGIEQHFPTNEKDLEKLENKNLKETETSLKFGFMDKNMNCEYPFQDENGLEFLFTKHSKSRCLYCDLLKGIHSTSNDEFEHILIEFLPLKYKNYTIIESQNELNSAIYQFLFEITFNEDRLFLYENLFPFLFEILANDILEDKKKIPIFIFLSHLLTYEKGTANLLLSSNYLAFHQNFICNFMQHFELSSFKYLNTKISQKNIKKKEKNKIINEENENKYLIFQLNYNVKTQQFESNNKIIDKKQYQIRLEKDKDVIQNKFTLFFWRLHSLLHIMKVMHDLLRSYPQQAKELLQNKLKEFVFQLVETAVIFFKISEKFIPTHPFHIDTECWNEIRNILNEIIAVVHQILLKMISHFSVFFNQFYKTIERNPHYCKNFILMIGKLPTLSSSRALVSSIFLFYDASRVVSQFSIEDDFEYDSPTSPQKNSRKEFFIIYLNAVTIELDKIKDELKLILEENEKNLSDPKIYNKKAVINILKLVLSCVQTCNIFMTDRNCLELLNSNHKNLIKMLLASIFPLLKLALHVNIKINIEKPLKMRNQPFSLKDKKTQYYVGKSSKEINCEELCNNFISVLTLFIYYLSKNNNICEYILKSEIFDFCFSKSEIPYSNEAFQCLMFILYNISFFVKNLDLIQKFYAKFPNLIIDFLNNTSLDINNILPLVRAVKILVMNSSDDSKIFRILLPRLRSLISYEIKTKEKSSKNPVDNLNISEINITENQQNDIDLAREFEFSLLSDLNSEESILSVFPPAKLSNSDQNIEKKFKILEKEIKDLLILLGVVKKGDLNYGKQKLENPRSKLVEGAGLISMGTLKEYKEKLIGRPQAHHLDSLAFIKQNQLTEESIEKIGFSSASFLKTELEEKKNEENGESITLNVGKFIIKSVNTGNMLINEFVRGRDGSKDLSLWCKEISGINKERKKTENLSESSVFLGMGKSIMAKIDEEYSKILNEKR